ncbi:MAG TPA: cellulase family glycosylhydrolase [Pseudolysinimonas sp.]|nr:cellulase family glycosylhydrolase [Pseudolysinimonas sp.]
MRGTPIARVLGAALVLGLMLGSLAAPARTEALAGAPIPRVDGNRLVDARTGGTWVPHGVNWPSFEYACQQGWAYTQGGATDAAAAAMASWGIDIVRLPLNEQCWLGVEGNPHYGTASGYRAAVRSFVSVLNARGIAVILDLHWTAPAGSQADGQRAMTSARSVSFWSSVATEYASVPAVIFDAFNEPYSRGTFALSWSCWRDGGCQAPAVNDVTPLDGAGFTVSGMQSLVDAIRGAGAGQPIMLAGLDYANDLRGWLSSAPDDDQLIASWHNYPGLRCQTASCWNSEIAPVAAVVPVLMSEFGQVHADGTDDLTPRMTWADAHGIGYLPWAWWVVEVAESPSAARYALITDTTTFAPKAPSGTLYSAHLRSRRGAVSAPPAPVRDPHDGPVTPAGNPVVRTPVGIAPPGLRGITDAGSGTAGPGAGAAGGSNGIVLKHGLLVAHQLKRLG